MRSFSLWRGGSERLAKTFDALDMPRRKKRLERLVVTLAAVGFLIHLGLICVARNLPQIAPEALNDLDRNYLHAVYTPFSFILFYEVLLLVFALPQSFTISIGKQYEIISLIIIRRVFKDIGEFKDPADWMSQSEAAYMVLGDMVGAVVMFLLVTLFHYIRASIVRAEPDSETGDFIRIKKSIAVLLLGLLLTLAGYNTMLWVGQLGSGSHTGPSTPMDLDGFFFPMFFEVMIFTDVFLLIVSLPFYERYEYVIRNSGFVIATVLLRFSLSTPKPYDLAVGLIAMVYGLCVLGVFSFFARVTGRQVDSS
ncbi:MAG: hypothetical protein AAGJ83_10240 [Planctomycetota bacterium]